MTRRIVISILLLTVIWSGCSREGKTPGRITLTWSMWALPSHLPAFHSAQKEFERLNPHIRINFINIPWNQYNSKLITMAAAKAAPDVMWIDRIWAAELMTRGAFADLAPLMKADAEFDLSRFTPGINDYFRDGDSLYALMSHYSVLLVIYNRDLFDEAGVPYPHDNWTWEDARQAAVAISQDLTGNGIMDRFGCVLPVAEYATLSSFVWQNGGDIWSTEEGKGINGPEAREAIQFFLELTDLKAQPSPSQMLTAEIGDLFKSGRLGFMLTWPSGIREYVRDVTFQWDVAQLPMRKTRATYGGGPAYAISAHSKHPQEAWEFMKFLLSKPVQLEMAQVGLVMPTIEVTKEELMQVFPEEKVIDAYYASLPYSRSLPRLTNLNRIMSTFNQHMEDIMYRVETVESATEKFDRFLKEQQP